MIELKNTENLQNEIDEVIQKLTIMRDQSISLEINKLYIDMEKLINAFKSRPKT